MNGSFLRGEIYFIRKKVDFDKEGNSIQGTDRPAIIVSNDIGNRYSPVLEVVYLTTRSKKPLPTHVEIQSSKYESTALCEQIDTIGKADAMEYCGTCTADEMKKIDTALAVSIGINLSIRSDAYIKEWVKALQESLSEEDEEEPKEPTAIKEDKTILPDVETQLTLAKIRAERDVYKRLYEELLTLAKAG